MYKSKRQVNRKSFDWYGLSQRFSIRKYHFGAASVLLGTALILGSPQATVKADDPVSANTAQTNSDQGANTGTNSATDGLKNVTLPPTASTTEAAVLEKPTFSDEEILKLAAASETPAITSTSKTAKEASKPATSDDVVKTNTEESTVTESNKKERGSSSKRSKRALSDGENIDYSGVKISGKLTNSKTEYAVGEQILGSYNLDVSSPSKIEEGGYILVTASSNEPLDTFEIGTSLRTEKVNDNQYKLYTGELSGGAYVNINVSYKLKKFETGKNSNTTITAVLYDKNNTPIKSADFTNENITNPPYVSVDTRNGIRKQTLLETNQEETEIDVSKSKDLQLSLKSTNKESAAITKIDHAVELPAGVTIAQTSLDAGWRLENGVAKYTRVVPSSTTMFASGDNTQNELLHLNVSNGGTPAEFLTGKKLTFKDSATYTDKSGFTNTTSDDVTVTVHAINPKKSIDGSDPGTVVGPVPTKSDVQVDIANITMEGDKSRVVNIAMPYVKTTTEDTRNIKLLGAYEGASGPASVKEVEISVDSNIDQNRAIEFYAIWTPSDNGKANFVTYEDNPESLGLNSTLTFEVYSVANGKESKIGEVSLRKGDAADKVALPDGITTVRLRPKGNMPLEASGLRQVGLFLSQDLKGLEEAKKLAKEGKKVESIVTSSVYTYGYDKPKVDVSKTTFANSRDAIKLAPTTNPITATLAGNKTQELSSQYEVYEYSPNGLGNRIYNKQIWTRKTFVDLQEINAKNAKLLVELPDGFSYAGNDDSVKTIENYNNSGKTVLEVTPKKQNSKSPLSPNLQFKVDKWVESGKYPVKYTLVWDEDERVVGINPNNDYDGTNATITNTSSFTYELPVINNSATRLMTQVTDQTTDSSTYSTGAYNLAPNDNVKYRLSLTNSSNAATRNNVVISTLPRVSDKNIVLNSKDRGSQFDVHMTAAATTPEGWTAYYSTTPVSGTAVDLEKTITLTADQVTDWSTVTAVKFVSNQDVALKAGSTAAFYIPAKASSTATNNQVAVLTSATRTDGQDTFNETNPARISIKIEDVKKGAVKVAYENKDNVSIKDTVTAIESRAYKKGYDVDTKEYKPDTLIGKDGKEYYFVKVKDSSPSPTGTINSPEVTVTYVYDLLYDETEESHTVTRTIKYVDAEKKTQVADPVTQTATIKRVNKVNRKTKEVIEGTWSTANWDEKISPSVTNYNAPNREKVAEVSITSATNDVTEIIEYTQAVDTKTVATKQTVTYEGAGEHTPAPNEQTDYTFTGKTNKVTNVTTWNEETHTYGVVTTPKVEGYYADKAQAGGKEVTPTNPEASDKVVYKPLGKVILVDEGGNEIPNTPKPTYKNNPNDPTVGGETPIPEIPDGYEIKPKQDVPGFNPEGKVVTPPKPGEDTRIVLVAKQGNITKPTKQTVTYEGAGENTPAPNEQTDYTFTGKTNKVTNVTTWNEETHTYGVVTTPKVEGYYADKAQAGGKEVTPTNPEASDKVVYKPLGKVILVDEGGNEIPNTSKTTYKNNPNNPTVGGETPIPEIPEGYEIKPKQDVPGFNPEGKVVTPQKPGEDTRIVLVAKQGDITKATKQTVTYEGAGEHTPAPNEQTDYTFTGKTNKVTNVTTWNEETHTYGVVTTPKVEGYYADKAQAGGKEVTPTNPEASDKVVYKPLGKVILVDEGGNEIPNTPKPTYKNNPNDPTVGGETPIPEIPDGYEIKPKQDVPGFNPEGKVVTPPKPGEDTRIVLVAKQGNITKPTKQTVTYEGAGENTPAPNEQTDYTFTGKTNKVTNVTTWNEETHTYGVVTTPNVEGYYADKAQAGGKEVTPTDPEASDKVVYKPLGKVILVDEGGNEIPNTPKPTYKNNPNDPTVGGETPIPEIPEGYEIKPKQDVPGFNPEGKVVTPQKPGEDTRIVLVAKQGDITKATKQTVTYEGAGENTPAPNEQTDYTFTGKTNKVTNVTTWNEETHTYGVVTTPKVEGYYADKAQAGGKEVTPTNPEASDKVVYKPLGKVILVDEGGNEIPNTPKPTYKNNPNDPTIGGETPIPEIPDGYEIKPKQDVPGFNPEGKVVTPPKPGEDTRIVLVAKQGNITKPTKQTVTYEGAGENTPAPNEQTDYTFTGKTNKVTNVTTWNEETHTYGVVTTPNVEGYYADKAQAGGKEVTPTDPEASDKVVYKPLGKVILVDEGGNEIPNTPKPTYKNNPNDPTVGGETPIPEIPAGYEIKPKQDVPGFNPEGKVVTPPKPGEDTRIVLVAKTVPVTPTTPQNPNEDPKNPNPGDPIDPKNPNGPTWTKGALDKLNNIKSVTRTITYIKDGTTEEVSPTEAPKWTDKVSFTRTVVVNPKDGSVVGYDKTGDGVADVPATDTTSGWTAAGTAKFAEVKSPVVKGYVVKPNQDTQGDLVEADGSKVKASATDLTVDSANQDLKVRYVPVGKLVPKVPEGVTPPTPVTPTPYENVPGEPGKVVPPSPTKPTDPQDPNSPKVPVIPHIPGTTPKDPNGNPLKPVDPTDPTKGYVPPTPKTPTENTEINYEKDTQKAVTKFKDPSGNPIPGVNNIEETGKSGEPLTKATEVTTEITKLIAKGYDLVSNNYGKDNNGNFDKDSGKDQEYTVVLTPHIQDVPPFDPTNPNDPNTPQPGKPIDPNNTNGPKWTPELIKQLNTTKHVTRTITYVDDKGNKVEYTDKAGNKSSADVADKVTFTREAKINVVTGTIEYGNWTPVNNDTTFDKVTSPVVPGYVLKDASQKEVAATENLTENSKDENIKVVYVPVGKLVPKVPEGVTPPTPVTPTPYENVPGEPGKVVPPSPTKPTDPQDPNSPKVPVIPHIPGTTPKDSNGNPLKPVDPTDPTKGYVPPTPKTPTENTEINYEKDTQKAVTKFVDPSGNLIPGVNNIEETGKSGEPLTKATEVTTEITKLIAKGYDLVSNNYGKDNNGNFDKDSGKDQEYTVVLTPHIEPIKPFDPTNPNDPNTPKPGQPIDPKNPDGPKWTPELIKQLNTTKHVTRTITYVDDKGNKVEYTDKAGNKSTADVADKVTFTRTAKINVVTGTIEYGNWTPVNNDTTFDKVTSPVVPGYVLKDASQKEVAATENLTENSKDENIKVVYVPVGKLVPKVPEGVTPPTPTPYDNVLGEPGKVVPPSPTKPTDPQDPNSPKVPVIPYIPGTTPQVPKDPTKPVDPNTNPLVPLKPIDPKDPSKGYEVPPVPTNPDTDTPIYYVNDKQKAITNFVDNNNKPVSDPVVDQGDSGSKFTKSGEVESKIKELVKKGYVVTSNDYPSADTDRVFDKDKDKDQIFNVKVTPLIVPTNPNSPDKPQVPTDPAKPVGPNNPLKPVTPSTPEPGKPVFPEDPNSPVWPGTVKDLVTETSATRTITYVDQNGKEVAATHSETIKFKRSAKVNLVTGDITYGDWTVVGNDTILDGNKLPKVDGYIARGGDIESSQKDVKATAGVNITETVVYDKLGSWIPKLPEGQNQVPPTPYPNDPTDPTKPGTDKPKVPYVPGFIPVDPEGQPLKPVDPNDPTKGYEVPDVPADPTQDTPIKYIPVPTPNNGGGNNGGGGGNIPTPQPQPQPNPAPAPQPEPSPAPNPVPVTPETPEQPVAPVTPEQPAEPAIPQYMDGQRELPNTGTESNSSLAALGLLGVLSGFGLIARKKRKDEE